MNKINRICDVCQCSHRRLALTVNEVLVCYDCIDFFKNEAIITKTDVMAVINKQIDYVMMYIDSNDEHECLCDDQDIIEEGFAKLERLTKRKEYGDAFDDMFDFPRI